VLKGGKSGKTTKHGTATLSSHKTIKGEQVRMGAKKRLGITIQRKHMSIQGEEQITLRFMFELQKAKAVLDQDTQRK